MPKTHQTLVFGTENFMVPAFGILNKDGSKVETLEHCFIEHMLLSVHTPPATLIAKNGSVYQAVYDNIILPQDAKEDNIKVIVSFQKHTYGKFAIIRNFKASKQPLTE